MTAATREKDEKTVFFVLLTYFPTFVEYFKFYNHATNLQNSDVLCRRFSQYDERWEDFVAYYWHKIVYHVCHFESVFLSEFFEIKFR